MAELTVIRDLSLIWAPHKCLNSPRRALTGQKNNIMTLQSSFTIPLQKNAFLLMDDIKIKAVNQGWANLFLILRNTRTFIKTIDNFLIIGIYKIHLIMIHRQIFMEVKKISITN